MVFCHVALISGRLPWMDFNSESFLVIGLVRQMNAQLANHLRQMTAEVGKRHPISRRFPMTSKYLNSETCAHTGWEARGEAVEPFPRTFAPFARAFTLASGQVTHLKCKLVQFGSKLAQFGVQIGATWADARKCKNRYRRCSFR